MADSSLGNDCDAQGPSPVGATESSLTGLLPSLQDYVIDNLHGSPGMNPLGYCRPSPLGDYPTAVQNRSCTLPAQTA